MAVVGIEQISLERLCVGQVAVVHQHNAKRCIHVERLCLFLAEGIARRGVTHLTQAAVAGQSTHVAGAKHIFDHALGLVHEKLAPLLGNDTYSILAAVLQQQQRVINQLIDRGATNDTDNSTHS